MREKNASTLENVFFGVALVLFLVVGFFAAKRFGLFPNRPSGIAAKPGPSPTGRFRVGIDDQDSHRPELRGRDAGPAVTEVPELKGARVNKRRRRTFVPDPK